MNKQESHFKPQVGRDANMADERAPRTHIPVRRDTCWFAADERPEAPGWYYTRQITGEITVRYFDDTNHSWWLCGSETMEPNNSFHGWLSIHGVSNYQSHRHDAPEAPKTGKEYRLRMDGDAWCATADNFVNLQESDAGFGSTPVEALQNLLNSEKRHAKGA